MEPAWRITPPFARHLLIRRNHNIAGRPGGKIADDRCFDVDGRLHSSRRLHVDSMLCRRERPDITHSRQESHQARSSNTAGNVAPENPFVEVYAEVRLASGPWGDPADGIAPDAAGRPESAAPGADDSADTVSLPDPAFAGRGRFGTRPLTRRESAACRISDAAAAALMPFSSAACCNKA